jgi:hypothetical protein
MLTGVNDVSRQGRGVDRTPDVAFTDDSHSWLHLITPWRESRRPRVRRLRPWSPVRGRVWTVRSKYHARRVFSVASIQALPTALRRAATDRHPVAPSNAMSFRQRCVGTAASGADTGLVISRALGRDATLATYGPFDWARTNCSWTRMARAIALSRTSARRRCRRGPSLESAARYVSTVSPHD